MSDFRKALELDEHFQRAKEGLETAQRRQKAAGKRDYYKILGVKRTAGKREITKAYRKLAQKWHPDNYQDAEEKKKAEKKFMDIAAAKEVLTDDGKLWLASSLYCLLTHNLSIVINRCSNEDKVRSGRRSPRPRVSEARIQSIRFRPRVSLSSIWRRRRPVQVPFQLTMQIFSRQGPSKVQGILFSYQEIFICSGCFLCHWFRRIDSLHLQAMMYSPTSWCFA